MTANSSFHRLSILGICCGMVVMAMIFSMVNMALPVIHHSLHASLRQVQWIMNGFGIVTCASLVLAGRLADIYGRKKIFLIGYATLAVALLGSGLSRSPNQIIFFMLFGGVGNAIMLPVSQAMLISIYPEHQKGRAISLWTANVGLALAGGPVIG